MLFFFSTKKKERNAHEALIASSQCVVIKYVMMHGILLNLCCLLCIQCLMFAVCPFDLISSNYLCLCVKFFDRIHARIQNK